MSRWSRRKRAAGREAAAPQPAAAAPPPTAVARPEGAPADAGPAFDPASLPPVESLTAESDFAAFLREEVPAALRRAALRRAWTVDAAIRDFVGPADYAWDFNAPDGMAGFSLHLGGDVERLIAQAVGLEGAPGEASADEPGRAPVQVPFAVEGAAPPTDAPLPAVLEPPDSAPGVERIAEAPGGTPIPEALPAPATPVAEVAPARRRHGGALPS